DRVPDRAIKWIETGAALGALKAGSRVATKFVRRNPAVAVAGAVGAGLLLYAVRRQQRKSREQAIEGKATRVEAKKAPPRRRTARPPAARSRSARRRLRGPRTTAGRRHCSRSAAPATGPVRSTCRRRGRSRPGG